MNHFSFIYSLSPWLVCWLRVGFGVYSMHVYSYSLFSTSRIYHSTISPSSVVNVGMFRILYAFASSLHYFDIHKRSENTIRIGAQSCKIYKKRERLKKEWNGNAPTDGIKMKWGEAKIEWKKILTFKNRWNSSKNRSKKK